MNYELLNGWQLLTHKENAQAMCLYFEDDVSVPRKVLAEEYRRFGYTFLPVKVSGIDGEPVEMKQAKD